MLFNSIEFTLFLPIVFLLYWFAFGKNLKLQNLFLILASYIFYGWWDWHFLLLIAFTSLSTWLSGIAMHSGKTSVSRAKMIVTASIILNLGILAVFKYYNFFIENFIELFSAFGFQLHSATLKLILPVGISFYTFQALSYSILVYRRTIEPIRDIVAFFAYISFFPLLLAGPIERTTNLLPQFTNRRTFDYSQAVDGMRQILWGLFKKIVVADNCAVAANKIFDTHTDCSGITLAIGAFLYTIQIYGDFSGYSDISIGVSRLFGFNLMRNFAFPYFSRDIAEFWRRWHISLTTWFKDFIYIPLGGSHCSKWKVIRNTWIIFLISGFWHGANWTFIAWGAFHAALFMPLLLLNKNRRNTIIVAENRILPTLKELASMFVTFGLVAIGWIIFRSETILEAYEYIMGMFSPSLFSKPVPIGVPFTLPFAATFVLLIVEWIGRRNQFALQKMPRNPVLRWSVYFLLIFSLINYIGAQQDFIYFQF
jgi:alginate O-acetyltransferase complex protein AlgI